ncbi:MAG: hypothetical protein NTY64_17930, partial [Deltaproteobacteria bacterium]|nr:hypothetical protein [Deltaproteobacteria bacterium]
MSIRKKYIFALMLSMVLLGPRAYGQDESALFVSQTQPDVLIVLDLSGSMNWTPAGEIMYTGDSGDCDSTSNPFYGESGTGHTKACTIYAYGDVPKYSNSSCTGPYYRGSSGTHTTDCSRLAIAKRGLYNILNDNGDSKINFLDEPSLGVRVGYMRFYDCQNDDTGGSYTSGCNQRLFPIGSKYSKIYCNSSSSCTASSSVSGSISGEGATGGTPLASALHEAKLYLDADKASDSEASCRQKFVLLITDGSDTFACGGTGNEGQADQYKRRRETVAQTKALADAGYKVFVVGFGAGMPHFARNTLNWAAFHGGTDNPLAANYEDPTAYDPSSFISCAVSTTAEHNIENDGN